MMYIIISRAYLIHDRLLSVDEGKRFFLKGQFSCPRSGIFAIFIRCHRNGDKKGKSNLIFIPMFKDGIPILIHLFEVDKYWFCK